MYSEQELTQVINEVIAGKIEDGAFDEAIADAVDDYLTEHPVDITALEGKTIAPAIVNATTSISAPSITASTGLTASNINGESNPSVKPIYCHPIEVKLDLSDDRIYYFSCLIFNNSATAFTWASFFNYIDDLCRNHGAVILCSGSVSRSTAGNEYVAIATCIKLSASDTIAIHGLRTNTYELNFNTIQGTMTPTSFVDGVNKIN